MTSPIAAGNGFSLIHVSLPADLKALELSERKCFLAQISEKRHAIAVSSKDCYVCHQLPKHHRIIRQSDCIDRLMINISLCKPAILPAFLYNSFRYL